MTDINDELIRKFLNDQCNRQEAEQVIAYLSQYPAELERVAGEEEWKQFKAAGRIPAELDAEIWERISRRTTARKPVLAYIRPWAVAASIAALLLTAGLLLNNKTSRENNSIALHTNAPKPASTAFALVTNTGSSVKTIALTDGSAVYLQPGSTLRYEAPFRSNARLLFLEGEAIFKVAKDKARPFTVQAAGFATTALGTSFRITVFKRQARVRVQLLTGRVVVKQADPDQAKQFREVFLLPGRELNIDTQTLVSAERNIEADEQLARYMPANSNRKPAGAKATEDTGLDFNNQPLGRIFTTLQGKYHVHLQYDHAAFNKIFFTGKFNSDEKIDSILHLLAVLNNLAVSREGEVYTIKK